MKKLLLTFCVAASLAATAQVTWTQQSTGFLSASTGINPVRIVDANNVWALGYDGGGAPADNYQLFTKTSNAGTTWAAGGINVGDATLLISDLTAISGTTAWVSATPEAGGVGGGVWKTTNSGITWTKQTSAAYNSSFSFANVVHFWDANNGVTMGDPTGTLMEIYVTSNGGTTWTQLTSGVVPPTQSGEYGYVHHRAIAGDNIWAGTNRGRIFKSADRGLTWSVVSTPLTDFGGTTSSGTIALKDANNGWILDNNGSVRRTVDGGSIWTSVALIPQANGIAYVPGTANTLIAVGNSTGSNISYNGGTTWAPIETTNQFVSIAALNNTSIWGGSFNTSPTAGGIYKLGGLLATGVTSAINGQISIYPNPTSDFLNIKSKEKIKSISLNDMSGKKIDVKFVDGVVNVKNLQSGTYVISVETAKGVSNSMFIKK